MRQYFANSAILGVGIDQLSYKLKTTYRGHQFAEEIQFTIEAGERTLLAIGRKEQPKAKN